ncbi:uncharacterized protein [Watersipora subatra]
MTYRDVVHRSGMSWSNMLKETSQIEFKKVAHAEKRHSACRKHNAEAQNFNSTMSYNWVRTENLEQENFATDRPYRNTYGDGRNRPSKLHLSTELPDLEDSQLSVEGVGQPVQTFGKDKWKPNHQIAKIYNLLHDGNVKDLSQLHVVTKKNRCNQLPIILPHFHIKLAQSINQVLRDAEIQPSAVYTRRPMTSEKFSYHPITEKSSNPELIILKTGKVEYRAQRASARKPIHKNKPSPVSASLKESAASHANWEAEASLTFKKLPKVERDSSKGRMLSKGFSISPRHAASKAAAEANSLQEVEGFPLSVKITPKVHPANEKPKLSV